MSLIANNSPEKFREELKTPEPLTPEPIKITTQKTIEPPTRVIATTPDMNSTQQMVDVYSFHEETKTKEPTELAILPPINLARPGVTLADLAFFCEERINARLYEPLSSKQIRWIKLNQKYLQDKLDIFSEYKEEITIGPITDTLHYMDGFVLIPEELLIVTGVLREHLKVENILVVFRTGEIQERSSKFCNFWSTERLGKFSPPGLNPNGPKPEILSENACLRCQLTCQFRRKQQIET